MDTDYLTLHKYSPSLPNLKFPSKYQRGFFLILILKSIQVTSQVYYEPKIVCGTPYRLSNIKYAGKDKEKRFPKLRGDIDISFNKNGKKLFVLEKKQKGRVLEFLLSVPYNLNTTYSVASINIKDKHKEKNPQSIAFSSDQKRMFILSGGTRDAVVQYDRKFVARSAKKHKHQRFFVKRQDRDPKDLAFSSNGIKMYILGGKKNKVFEYDLKIPFSIEAGNVSYNEVNFSLNIEKPSSLAFSDDGLRMFVLDAKTTTINEYKLGSHFSLSSVVPVQSFSLKNEMENPKEILFSDEGSALVVVGQKSKYPCRLVTYNLSPSEFCYTEASTNSGILTCDDNPLMFTVLGSSTFVDANNDGELDGGVHLDSIPPGLEAHWRLSDFNTTATLEFSREAIYHEDTDSMDHLEGSFNADQALTVGTGILSFNPPVKVCFSENPRRYLHNHIYFKNGKQHQIEVE